MPAVPSVPTVQTVPTVPAVPAVPTVPTVPTLNVERTQYFYLINTNFHQVHQLINYFVFERERKKFNFRFSKLDKKMDTYRRKLLQLAKCASCSNKIIKS